MSKVQAAGQPTSTVLLTAGRRSSARQAGHPELIHGPVTLSLPLLLLLLLHSSCLVVYASAAITPDETRVKDRAGNGTDGAPEFNYVCADPDMSSLLFPVPTITRHPRSAVVARRHSHVMRCSVRPDTARLQWTVDGTPLDQASVRGVQVRGNSLHFRRIHYNFQRRPAVGDNEGKAGGKRSGKPAVEYRCLAITAAGTVISHPAVLSPPVLRPFPVMDDIHIEVVHGGFATIPCPQTVSKPPALISVLSPSGHLLRATDGVLVWPSGSVTLQNVSLSDAGDYACVAVNSVSGLNYTTSHHIKLDVLPALDTDDVKLTKIVDTGSVMMQVVSGQPVSLECPVSGAGRPNVTWDRAYFSLPSSIYVEYGVLHLSTVDVQDGGVYTCHSPEGKKRIVYLNVQKPPQVYASHLGSWTRLAVIYAKIGQSARVMCRGEAFPEPDVRWFHNGLMYKDTNFHSQGNLYTLAINRVTAADGGLYVCELSNVLGSDSAVLQLVVVREAPRYENFTEPYSNGTSVPQAVDGAAFGHSSVKETLRKNLGPSTSKHISGGSKNTLSRRHQSNRKQVNAQSRKAKLVPPTAPVVERLSDTTVLVRWSVPDNDGLPIRFFMVQYKAVGSSPTSSWQTIGENINNQLRQYRVSGLKPDGLYKFRMAAAFSNDDNRNSPNSKRFHLRKNHPSLLSPPRSKPKIVLAQPITFENVFAINVKWQYFPDDLSATEGFTIFYKPYTSEQEFAEESLNEAVVRRHTIRDLFPDTDYVIRMISFNSAGSSDLSNIVVKRTEPTAGKGVSPYFLPPPPPEIHTAAAPPSSNLGDSPSFRHPVTVGIVFGVTVVLLIVFGFMCWWRNSQHKVHGRTHEGCLEFSDEAHQIYVGDSLPNKHGELGNGGAVFAYSSLTRDVSDGQILSSNGHCPSGSGGGRPCTSIEVNPMSEMMCLQGYLRARSSKRRTGAGIRHHGTVLSSNASLPVAGHGRLDENIDFTAYGIKFSSEDVLNAGWNMANGNGGLIGLRHNIAGDRHCITRRHPCQTFSLPHRDPSSLSVQCFDRRMSTSSEADRRDSGEDSLEESESFLKKVKSHHTGMDGSYRHHLHCPPSSRYSRCSLTTQRGRHDVSSCGSNPNNELACDRRPSPYTDCDRCPSPYTDCDRFPSPYTDRDLWCGSALVGSPSLAVGEDSQGRRLGRRHMSSTGHMDMPTSAATRFLARKWRRRQSRHRRLCCEFRSTRDQATNTDPSSNGEDGVDEASATVSQSPC